MRLTRYIEIYDPTIEDSYRKQVAIDSQPCCFEIMHTASREEYIALRDEWIRDGEAFILMYSIPSKVKPPENREISPADPAGKGDKRIRISRHPWSHL
ncbi:hypothetical protein K469DRAFT_706676 [Zopfia rhizophila CBS 207.26]|uniref:Uncharacterized protein n=1 Tax=Zopfia rhizophila CBS 207.26 TaxID=1314779 RepID=A0A6A6E7Y4_9PEZI|nr:hypothetical protein K469DRAFT_706676 [Zopfia rhizophila CBS 207.26]